ncbi:MAG: tetratricopeptide repeat protein [Elusimicrobiota bacterium]
MKINKTTGLTILLALVITLVYVRTVFFGFVYFDDDFLILDNLQFLQNPVNILTAFKQDVFRVLHDCDVYYRPMMVVSLIIDAQYSGAYPWGYHLGNVLLHVLCCCLLFVFLKKLGYPELPSFFMALLFGVHPLLTQAVAWIPGRNDTLLTLFVLTATIFFLDYARTGKPLFLCCFILGYTCAMFTKETAVAAIGVYAFIWVLKSREGICEHKRYIKIILSSVFIAAAWFIIRDKVLAEPMEQDIGNLIESVVSAIPAFVQLVGKVLFPFNLSPMVLVQDTTLVTGIIAIIVIAALFHPFFRKRLEYMALGMFWLIIFLVPSFLRVDNKNAVLYYEHRMYLPVIGLIILLLETKIVDILQVRSKIVLAVQSAVIMLFCFITFTYSYTFSNRMILWQTAVRMAPHSSLAHRNLGVMLFMSGFDTKAEFHYRKALEICPVDAMAHNNIGLIYVKQGKFREAEAEFLAELKVNPYYDVAHFNLGLLYYRLNNYKLAELYWKHTLELNPEYTDTYYNLAMLYYQTKRYDYAQYFFAKAKEYGDSRVTKDMMNEFMNKTKNTR